MTFVLRTISLLSPLRIVVLVSLLVIAVQPARAGIEELKPSTSEDIAIAFYRFVDAQPDFRRWIEASEVFQSTEAVNRAVIYQTEKRRLVGKFREIAPRTQLFTIEVPVVVKITKVLEATNKPYLLEFLPRIDEVSYFPYSIADIWFAVIIRDLDTFLSQRIEEWEYVRLIRAWPQLGSRTEKMNLRAHVKITDADARAPVLLDGQHQWLMMTELASMSLWRADDFVWEYQAPWYETPTETELKKLFVE